MLASWLTEPLWDRFVTLLSERPEHHPDHPLGCHRRRISDRNIFDKMLQLLRFGYSYEAIADTTCSAARSRPRGLLDTASPIELARGTPSCTKGSAKDTAGGQSPVSSG